MHSLAVLSWMVVVGGVGGRALAPAPVITPAPSVENRIVELAKRDDPDAVSLAEVLLTAVPEWLREIAATNIPAASSIIWSEFLDGNRPSWFTDLPEDIQSYLIKEFGPKTSAPASNPSGTSVLASLTESLAPTSSAALLSESSGPSQPQKTTAATKKSQSGASSTDKTQHTGSATATSASESLRSSKLPTSGFTISTAHAAPSTTSTEAPSVSPSTNNGLSRSQKIGIGIGVPLGLAGAAAFLFMCCFLLRRKHRKGVDGSVPPSSPGFIPRFSFQEKPTDLEHRPLNPTATNAVPDWTTSAWDDDVVEPAHDQPVHPVATQPAITPAIFHTHSSNRARGKRTSYTSLHSVAEVSEPDDPESPILPRETPPRRSPHRQSPPKLPSLTIPPMPVAAQIKRKPIGSPPSQSPAAQAASQSLLRQTMGEGQSPYRHRHHSSLTGASPISPIQEHESRNPFRDSSPYVEDYGPEFQNGYIDVEDGLYGHRSLSRYPEPKSSRTEWPLRNTIRQKRTKSPLWDRVYDG